MGKTSTAVKNRWNSATYKRYTVSLRKDTDADIIQFLEKEKLKNQNIITEIFRKGIEQLLKGSD